MLILFFKAAGEVDHSKEPPVDKMRRVLEDNLRLAKTEDDRRRVMAELEALKSGSVVPASGQSGSSTQR